MSEQSKKVALPAYLPRRLEAFRIVKDDKTTYILRDKLLAQTYDLEPWQFFVLEVLPGCETSDKLLSVFEDRYGRATTEPEVMTFFGWLADKKLLDKDAEAHPLLKPFTRQGYALEQGLVKPKSFEELAAAMGARQKEAGAAPVPAPAAAPAAGGGKPATPEEELAPGVNDADNLDPRRSRNVLPLVPLRGLLDFVVPMLAPLKWVIYVLPVLVLAGILVLVQYWDLVSQDLETLSATTTLVSHAIFSMFTINLVAVLTQAAIAHHYRASVGTLGIGLFLGFLPRFVVRIGHTQQLSRRERIWLHGGPLLARLALFGIGVLLWYNLRDGQTDLARGGLALAFVAAVNLLVASGNPLVRGNAYHLLCAVMDERRLRGKSYRALMESLHGGGLKESEDNVLAGYALATFIYAYILAIIATLLVLKYLRSTEIGGAALIIAVVLGVYLTAKAVKRFKRINLAYKRAVQFDRWRKRALPAEAGETIQVEPQGNRAAVYFRRALALSLLLALFLPYPYEPGGHLKVFPSQRQVLTSDVGGVIQEINFDGGETVPAGTVVARIATTDLDSQVAVIDARIKEQAAVIADLKARPKPEEVEVAQRFLELAQERARFSGDRVPRLESLYQKRAISFEELDTARKESEVDQREVARAQSAVKLSKVGTPPDRLQAEAAKLDSLRQEREAVLAKSSRTVLKMPFEGTILTLRLQDRLNSVLDKGTPFAVVEGTKQVYAEIEVPESDVGYVKVGAPVSVRTNAFADREFAGQVKTIDRDVTAQSFGNVVKVIAQIDNDTGDLRTGMTGYAKVEGLTMPVWKAFSLAIQRFVLVQMWAWIP
jgi:putative peptide zinc metalloprotease protein